MLFCFPLILFFLLSLDILVKFLIIFISPASFPFLTKGFVSISKVSKSPFLVKASKEYAGVCLPIKRETCLNLAFFFESSVKNPASPTDFPKISYFFIPSSLQKASFTSANLPCRFTTKTGSSLSIITEYVSSPTLLLSLLESFDIQ